MKVPNIKKWVQNLYSRYPLIIALLILFPLFFVFFSYSLTVTWDSAHYMSYVEIFRNEMPGSSWDIVRGPIFPIFIFISGILFGKNAFGLLISFFICYLLMFGFSVLIIKMLKLNKKVEKFLLIIVISLILANPIIFGYYHTLLTEPIAITLAVLGCYLSIKFLYLDVQNNKKSLIIYSIIFSLLLIFSWFLKQSYISTILFPFVISILISILNKFEIKNILYRIFPLLLSVICLFLSVSLWNITLSSKGVELNSDRNVVMGFGNYLIGSIKEFEILRNEECYTRNYIEKESFISMEERNILIKNKFKDYSIIDIYKDNKKIESEIIESNNGNVTTKTALMFLLKSSFKYPRQVFGSYFNNYMTLINVYGSYTLDNTHWYPSYEFDADYSNENTVIAYRIFNESENIFYMTPEMRESVSSFYQPSSPPVYLNKIMKFLSIVYVYIFKINFILLPITFISAISFKIYSLIKKKSDFLLDSIIILSGFSFGHLLLHTVTVFIIDRYASPAIITAMISNILLFYAIFKIIKNKKKNGTKR